MEHHPTREVKVETRFGDREGVRIIKVSGPLTLHNFFEFQDLSRRDTGPGVLLIDLTEVPYIDSAALGSLIGIHVSSERLGRKYALINVNDRLRSLFAMAHVDQFLVRYPSVAEAEAALAR